MIATSSGPAEQILEKPVHRHLTELVPVARIDPAPNARASGEDIESIKRSMTQVGQLHPVVVRPKGGLFELVAGHRRYKAAKALGWETMMVTILAAEKTGQDAELIGIDENLERAPLSKSERMTQTARQKEIYEALHPEASHGGKRATGQKDHLPRPPRFTKAKAKATGQSERSVRRDAKIGTSGSSALLLAVDNNEVTDSQAEKIAGLPPEEQESCLQKLLAGQSLEEQEARLQSPSPISDKPPTVSKTSEQKELKQKVSSAVLTGLLLQSPLELAATLLATSNQLSEAMKQGQCPDPQRVMDIVMKCIVTWQAIGGECDKQRKK